MDTGHQDEQTRQAALNAQQAQAEQDFIAAREQLAAQDAAARQAEQERGEREEWLAVIKAQQTNSANENRPLSFEDLHEHPAHVLDRVIFPNASTELLQAAYAAAADVKKFAETADLGGTEDKPFELLLYVQADNIQDDIRTILESRGVFIPQDPTNQNTPEHLSAVADIGRQQEPQPEALTLEAIERDPWNAVRLDIPKDADRDLLQKVLETSDRLGAELDARYGDALTENDKARGDYLAAVNQYREANFLIGRMQAGGDKGAEEARAAYAAAEGAERDDIARDYIKAGMRGLTIGKELAADLGEEIGASYHVAKSILYEAEGPFSAEEYKGLTLKEAAEKINTEYERDTAQNEQLAEERLNTSGFSAEGPLDMPQDEALTPEQAALFELIRADLDELFTNCEPSELDEIARTAAVQNIEQRTAPGERVTLQDLQGEPYSDEIRAGLAKPIPEDASLYLVHRVNEAAEVELDGMTDRDADPYSREDLEKIAAMDARAYEAKDLLHEMTRDRADEPERGPDGPDPEGPTSGPRNDDPPPHGPSGPGGEAVGAAEGERPDHDPDGPSSGGAAAKQPEAMTLEELACLSQGESGERRTDAPEIDAADSFRMGASATTSTEQGQKDRDVAARILALEELTGNEESKAHYAYASTQRNYGERIASADSPDLREGLQAERFAHSQTYAADLCEQGYIQHGLDGRFEEALLLRQEGNLHREIAEGVTQRGPEPTPPDRSDDAGNIADSMAAAATEALGPTAKAAAIVEGPTPEQQQGQQPAAHEIRGEPGKGDYAALREETAAFEEGDERATIANHGLNIRAMMEVSPEGTYIASRPKSDFAAHETDYEGGPVRPGFVAVAAALAATQEAASDERAEEETRIQAADTKAKHEEASGAKAAELHTATSEASNEASSRPMSRAERAAAEAAEYAAEAEREQESGHAITGTGGGRGGR